MDIDADFTLIRQLKDFSLDGAFDEAERTAQTIINDGAFDEAERTLRLTARLIFLAYTIRAAVLYYFLG